MDLRLIDIEGFLRHNEIPYITEGKNVSAGWAEINCPFPDCGDKSFHCGINLESGFFSCWICGRKGPITSLVQEIYHCGYYLAARKLEEFPRRGIPEEELNRRREKVSEVVYPKYVLDNIPNLHRNYLIKRGFNPDELVNNYKIRATSNIGGAMSFRVIVPIILDGILVNYTGRDVTGTQKTKYKNLENDKAIIPMKQCVYNLDSVRDRAIICEGVTDVWRIGPGAIATMGKTFTLYQINLIRKRGIKDIFVMYDSDAIRDAEALAGVLSTIVNRVEILELDSGDPGDLSAEEVREIRREVFNER